MLVLVKFNCIAKDYKGGLGNQLTVLRLTIAESIKAAVAAQCIMVLAI